MTVNAGEHESQLSGSNQYHRGVVYMNESSI